MQILLTGGLGYIGSHTAVQLILEGHKLIVVDNLDNSDLKVLNHIESITKTSIPFRKVDVKSREELAPAFEEFNIAGVIHFAAKKSVPESLSKPLLYYQDNLQGLINLISLAEEHKITNFIFSSSCTVYGEPKHLPVTEETPTQFSLSPYGNTKRWAEEILSEYSNLKSLKTVLLRYFNPVGAHESGLIGELPNGIPSNLMPFVTQTAAGLREELKVFGDDYNTPDGTAIRDFIHVMDLADAHVRALQWLMQQNEDFTSEVFNVGTGNGFSVLEIIQSFEKTSGKKLPYSFAPRREGDIEQIWADPSKIKSTLSWEPKYNLDDMTRTAWNWQKSLEKV